MHNGTAIGIVETSSIAKGFEIADLFLIDMGNRQTAGAVARFAVDQGQTGVRGDLLAVDRVLKIIQNLIVLMAFDKAVFIADIVGIEPADEHPLVFPDRHDLLVRAQIVQIGTGGQKGETQQCQ